MSDFSVGCYVKIKGLTSKPRYNGFTGRIFVAQNQEGRWGVEFFFVDGVNDLKTILAKETNLEVSRSALRNSAVPGFKRQDSVGGWLWLFWS
eukprot:s4012_g6.t1